MIMYMHFYLTLNYITIYQAINIILRKDYTLHKYYIDIYLLIIN
jgi:hypothetical protein